MRHLLTVDPGANHPAVARWHDGVLVCAERVKLPRTWVRLDPLDRVRKIAEAVNAAHDMALFDEVVVELPQVYARGKSKGDPNDLILLAAVCGAVVAHCRADARVVCYRPRQWAGNIPKATTGDPWASPRGRLIWSQLSESERAAAPHDHDSADAIGIGLWHLGRLLPRRVLPGVTD